MCPGKVLDAPNLERFSRSREHQRRPTREHQRGATRWHQLVATRALQLVPPSCSPLVPPRCLPLELPSRPPLVSPLVFPVRGNSSASPRGIAPQPYTILYCTILSAIPETVPQPGPPYSFGVVLRKFAERSPAVWQHGFKKRGCNVPTTAESICATPGNCNRRFWTESGYEYMPKHDPIRKRPQQQGNNTHKQIQQTCGGAQQVSPDEFATATSIRFLCPMRAASTEIERLLKPAIEDLEATP